MGGREAGPGKRRCRGKVGGVRGAGAGPLGPLPAAAFSCSHQGPGQQPSESGEQGTRDKRARALLLVRPPGDLRSLEEIEAPVGSPQLEDVRLLGVMGGRRGQRVVHPHGLVHHLSHQTLPCRGAVVLSLPWGTGSQKRGDHRGPPSEPFWAFPCSPPCVSGLCTPFLPSGSRGPSLEARCGTSSSRACPTALPQEQNTQEVWYPNQTQTHMVPSPRRLSPSPGARKHAATYQHHKTIRNKQVPRLTPRQSCSDPTNNNKSRCPHRPTPLQTLPHPSTVPPDVFLVPSGEAQGLRSSCRRRLASLESPPSLAQALWLLAAQC